MGNDAVEQTKERLGVAEVIGEYLKLEKSGVNYKALCPFHNERTPSFTVNTERNFWYCFGCQEGGDIFTFVQKIEGLEFKEALKKLAEKANVELPKFNAGYNKEEYNLKKRALEALELATRIYQQQLVKGELGKKVLEYLRQRGFTGEAIKVFRLGYAPDDWRYIINILVNKGYTLAELEKAGLIIKKKGTSGNATGDYYDRFRQRIMFPIVDINGKVVGYSARLLPGGDEQGAKYINSPQSIVYDKSSILYGLYQARQAIRQSGYVILVEGNADAVLSYGAGVKNAVAISGTALTDQQVKILKRYTSKIMLAFDADRAGRKATEKSIQTCLRNDLRTKVIILPEGCKDVGEVIEKNKKLWYQAVKKARPIMEYFFEDIFSRYNIDNIEDKKEAIHKLIKIIGNIFDPIEQGYWLKELAIRTNTEESILTELLKKVKLKEEELKSGSSRFSENAQQVKEDKKDRLEILQCRLIGLLSHFPDELKKQLVDFPAEKLFSGQWFDVFVSLKSKKNEEKWENVINECIARLLYIKDTDELVERKIQPIKEWLEAKEELCDLRRRQSMKNIELQLKKAENQGDEQRVNVLMEQLNELVRKQFC